MSEFYKWLEIQYKALKVLRWTGQVSVSIYPNRPNREYVFCYSPAVGPFVGNLFQLQIIINDMRNVPAVHLLNKAYFPEKHPNVYSNGKVCLGTKFIWRYNCPTALAALLEHLKNIMEHPNNTDPAPC